MGPSPGEGARWCLCSRRDFLRPSPPPCWFLQANVDREVGLLSAALGSEVASKGRGLKSLQAEVVASCLKTILTASFPCLRSAAGRWLHGRAWQSSRGVPVGCDPQRYSSRRSAEGSSSVGLGWLFCFCHTRFRFL